MIKALTILGTLIAVNAIGIQTMRAADCVPDDRVIYKTSDKYKYTFEESFDKSIDSFEAWIKAPKNSIGGTIMGNFYNDNRGFKGACDFKLDALGRVQVFWNYDQGSALEWKYTFQSVHLDDGLWHHLAIVRDDAQGKFFLYVDGELKEEVEQKVSDAICTMPMNVGVDYANWMNSKEPFDGSIRQITLYNGAISQDKIKSDMETQDITDKYDGKLLGNWLFGDKWVDKEVKETSGTGNEAILKSFEKYVDMPELDSDSYDYTIVAIPDVQTIMRYRESDLYNMMYWLIANKNSQKIKFCLQTGDLSDVGGTEVYYQTTAYAFSYLDSIIPYSFVPGNHDYNGNCSGKNEGRDTIYYNEYFPYEKYSQMQNFGGAFEEGKMDNTYWLYDIDGAKYCVINLEFGPRNEVIRWAGKVCQDYSDYRVIINTHCYVDADANVSSKGMKADATSYGFAESAGATSGTQLENGLVKKYPNIFCVISGHINQDDITYRQDYGENGNLITSFLIDVQASRFNGEEIGLDMIMLMRVNEKEKTIRYQYYSPSQNKLWNVQNDFSLSFADENNPAIGKAEASSTPSEDDTEKPATPSPETNNIDGGMIALITCCCVVGAGAIGSGITYAVIKSKKKTK